MSNNGMFPKRPNRYDDEDELLRQNQEFEESKINSSAKPVKVQTRPLCSKNVKDQSPKKSRFAQSRKKSGLKREHNEASQSVESSQGVSASVLKDSVVEKMIVPSFKESYEMADCMNLAVKELNSKEPFPEAKIWNKDILTPKVTIVDGSKKKVSIFAQQLLNEEQSKDKSDCETKTSTPMVVVESHDRDWGSESRIFKNAILKSEDSKFINQIHNDNASLLNKMSEEQLIASQKELMEKVDPSLLAFLRNKKKNNARNSELSGENMQPMEIDAERISKKENHSVDEKSLKVITEPNRYLNMDKIEKDKMEWMSDINDTEEQNKPTKESFNARFDFNGCLLPYKDSSIPVTAALHHHGDEPDRPGYTLEELLTLARSVNPKQRSIAFDTMSNVIKNSKEGRFDFCFGTKSKINANDEKDIKDSHVNVLVELLDADLVTILRLTIDESAHTSALVLDSSINCLAQIIDNPSEEMAIDKQFFVSFGPPHQPCLKTKICTEPDFLKDEKEMKDIQILKSDLILGLLRMDILDRFSYLLSVTRPSNPTILNILKILSRMCRHSIQTVSTVMNHSSLISVIIENFLPSRSAVFNSKSIYNTPVHCALKLIRIIMAWGRGFTSEILDKFDLTSRLLVYCSLVPGESSNPVYQVQESLQLTIEAYRCWVTCLDYGLMVNAFIEFHPVIIKHLLYLKSSISFENNSKNDKDKFDYDYAVAFIKVIECAMRCIPCENIESFTVVTKEVAQMTSLGWEYFTGASGIMEIIEDCIKRWTAELGRNVQMKPKYYQLDLIASCFQLLGTFVKRFSLSELFKPITFINTLKDIIKHINIHIFKSGIVSDAISKANKLTIFDCKEKDGRIRAPENLPSLGAIGYGGTVLGILTENSPFGFLNAYISLILSSLKVDKALFDNAKDKEAFLNNVLKHANLQKYMDLVINQRDSNTKSNWFTKPELSMLFKIIMMDCIYLRCLEGSQIWLLAASLVQHLQVGQEYELSFLLKHVLFSPKYINSVNQVSEQLSNLNVQEKSIPKEDRGMQSMNATISYNWEEQFPRIEELYSGLLLPNQKLLKQSTFHHHQLSYSIPSLTIKSNGETILPNDWEYLPLLTIMQQRQSDTRPESKFSTDKSSDESEIVNVRDCLLWLYVTTIYTSDEKTLSTLQIAVRFSRLSTVFLAAPDLFMDDQIQCLLTHTLSDTIVQASRKYKNGFRFQNKKIPGIDSYKEFYEELISQFEAVSYGNELFAMVLLLPLTAANTWEYRSVFWCDHQNNLRLVTLKENQLPTKVINGHRYGLNLQNFVVADEKKDLIRSYVKHVIHQNITMERNPLLFEIARANIINSIRNDVEMRQEIDCLQNSLSQNNVLREVLKDVL